MKPTKAEIEAAKTEKGGWTKETLEGWGVSWPPPKGWKQELLRKPSPSVLIVCPACSHKVILEKIKRTAKLICSVCGALNHRVYRRIRVWMDTTDSPLSREEARRAVYAGLRYLAEEKGYKPGYVGIKFRELFGVWPDGLDTEPAPPSAELIAWLEQSKTRWKAARKKAEKNKPKPIVPQTEQYASMLMQSDDWEVIL